MLCNTLGNFKYYFLFLLESRETNSLSNISITEKGSIHPVFPISLYTIIFMQLILMILVRDFMISEYFEGVLNVTEQRI